MEEEVEEQYLKALDLLQKPSMDALREADALLRQLGLSWRLSDAVWGACSTPSASTLSPAESSAQQAASSPCCSISTAAKPISTPIVFPPPDVPRAVQQYSSVQEPGGWQDPQHSPSPVAPSLLPASLLSALQAAFDPWESPYWADHAYHDPDTPFFSYVHDLRQPPSNIVELAAQSMWEGLCRLWGAEVPWKQQLMSAQAPLHPANPSTQGAVDWPYSRVTHVEWWAHTRPPDGFGHQLHFDCDETRLRKGAAGYRLVHPCLSSVVFLSGGEEKGLGDDDSGAFAYAGNGTSNASSTAQNNVGTGDSRKVDRGSRGSGLNGGPPTVVLDQWPGKGSLPIPQLHSPASTTASAPAPSPAAPTSLTSSLDFTYHQPQAHSPALTPAPAAAPAAAGLGAGLDVATLAGTGAAGVGTGEPPTEASKHVIKAEERGEMECEGVVATAAAAAVGNAAEEEGRQYLADRCWVVHPQAGQVLLFPGNLLHGVLPHRPLGLTEPSAPRSRTDEAGELGSRAPGCCCSGPCSTPEANTRSQTQGPKGSRASQQEAGGRIKEARSAKGWGHRTTLIFAWWAEEGPGQQQQQLVQGGSGQQLRSEVSSWAQQQRQQQQQLQQGVDAHEDALKAQALCPQQVPPTRAWLSQASQHAQRLVHRSRRRAAAKAGAAGQGKRGQGEGAFSSPSLYVREGVGKCKEDGNGRGGDEGDSAKRQKMGHRGDGVMHGIVSTEQRQHLVAEVHEKRHEQGDCMARANGDRESEDSWSSSSSGSSGSSESEGSESDQSREVGSACFSASRSWLPGWCQHFINLMLSVQSLPDALHPRLPAIWTLPPPISPAWSLIDNDGRSQGKVAPTSLKAIPDLRFCIPRPTYFKELYPVDNPQQ